MMRAKLQPVLPVLVYLANSKTTQAGRPRPMVYTYTAVEVAKEDKVIPAVDVLDGNNNLFFFYLSTKQFISNYIN